jgi:hypothetical protein
MRKLAALAAIVGVTAVLAAPAGAATKTVSPTYISAAVASCLLNSSTCAAKLNQFTDQIGQCGADPTCSAAVKRWFSYLPTSWKTAFKAAVQAAIDGGADASDLSWLLTL